MGGEGKGERKRERARERGKERVREMQGKGESWRDGSEVGKTSRYKELERERVLERRSQSHASLKSSFPQCLAAAANSPVAVEISASGWVSRL